MKFKMNIDVSTDKLKSVGVVKGPRGFELNVSKHDIDLTVRLSLEHMIKIKSYLDSQIRTDYHIIEEPHD